jgi:hypothetical protein
VHVKDFNSTAIALAVISAAPNLRHTEFNAIDNSTQSHLDLTISHAISSCSSWNSLALLLQSENFLILSLHNMKIDNFYRLTTITIYGGFIHRDTLSLMSALASLRQLTLSSRIFPFDTPNPPPAHISQNPGYLKTTSITINSDSVLAALVVRSIDEASTITTLSLGDFEEEDVSILIPIFPKDFHRPHLKILTVSLYTHSPESHWTSLRETIRLNPQLTSLTIHCGSAAPGGDETWFHTLKRCIGLERLSLCCRAERFDSPRLTLAFVKQIVECCQSLRTLEGSFDLDPAGMVPYSLGTHKHLARIDLWGSSFAWEPDAGDGWIYETVAWLTGLTTRPCSVNLDRDICTLEGNPPSEPWLEMRFRSSELVANCSRMVKVLREREIANAFHSIS